jgi:hypothetical protein
MYDFYCVLIGYVGTYFVIFKHWFIYFWCTVWKEMCFRAQYTFLITFRKVLFPHTFLMYRGESILFLCTLHISDVPPGMCSVCTEHISDIPSGKCYVCVNSIHLWLPCGKFSVCVHGTHFWCTVWKVTDKEYSAYIRPNSMLWPTQLSFQSTSQRLYRWIVTST